MKDYHGLYLKCDVLLLADVFENFRNNSLKNYGLCPGHYLSAPALSWDVMPNMTKVALALILILTCICSLKKVRVVEFLMFVIYIVKATTSI